MHILRFWAEEIVNVYWWTNSKQIIQAFLGYLATESESALEKECDCEWIVSLSWFIEAFSDCGAIYTDWCYLYSCSRSGNRTNSCALGSLVLLFSDSMIHTHFFWRYIWTMDNRTYSAHKKLILCMIRRYQQIFPGFTDWYAFLSTSIAAKF